MAAAYQVSQGLTDRSGSIFYSGQLAFSSPCPIYILGLNPGGSPELQAQETIGRDLMEWSQRPKSWSRYVDEAWRGQQPGTYGMQPRIRHMFDALGLDLRQIPASNVVFVRTNSEADLRLEANDLFSRCWHFHETVIKELEIHTLLCLGTTAGAWARSRLNAYVAVDGFRETNARGWMSNAHVSAEGIAVVTLTHPGRADWRNPQADPTPLVRSVLNRI
ncbi:MULTISPECIES: hypothetical protein [unclassified Sphingomonas]|uniref:hypothetical protein n=1 Tax=Novosphingobium rhizosphaerae TaxID=1551649 RepID=UPI0015CA828C